MSKLTETLREKKVYNEYEFYGTQPYISYYPAHSVIPAHWSVCKQGLNLGRAWYDHNARTFSTRGNRKQSLIEAQAWESETFGVKTWARDPFGSYGEVEFIKQRIKQILEAL